MQFYDLPGSECSFTTYPGRNAVLRLTLVKIQIIIILINFVVNSLSKKKKANTGAFDSPVNIDLDEQRCDNTISVLDKVRLV